MAVFGTVGHGGRGKTLSVVHRLWKRFKSGREIWSNTPLVDKRVRWNSSLKKWVPYDPKTFGLSWASRYVYTVEDVLDAAECDLLLDELGAWVPSDEHKTIPRSFRRLITQDRRNGLNIFWTYRHEGVWKEIRDNTVEIRRTYRYLWWIFQRNEDCEDRKGKPLWAVFIVHPSVYDLYETFAQVGDRNGQGYGVGSRAIRDGRVLLTNWTEHGLTISLTPRQWEAFVHHFGYEALGMQNPEVQKFGCIREVDEGGVVRYRSLSGGVPLPLPL